MPEDEANPAEPKPVEAGAEEAGGCPNTVFAVVVALLTMVGVVAAGATVLMTGVTSMELLSVAAGAG